MDAQQAIYLTVALIALLQMLLEADQPRREPGGFILKRWYYEYRSALVHFLNNAVLVLAGDISPDEGFRLADRYFGDLPPGPDPSSDGLDAPGAAPAPRRSVVLPDRVTLSRVYRAYATGTPIVPVFRGRW